MNATPVQFLDGGLGTSLEDKYGVHFTETTPLWSSHLLLSDHDTLKSCQRDFAEVPVDILLTATYQVSVEGFQRTRTDSFPEGVLRAEIPPFLDVAVSIVEQVKRPATKIALSLGPYGAVMTPSQEYTGRYDNEHNSVEKLFRWHADRISLFTSVPRLDSRVDFVAFETVSRLDEILAIRKLTTLLASQSPDATDAGPLERTRFWISCVFPGSGQALPDGSSVGQVAELPQLVKAYEVSVRRLEEDGHLQSWPSLLLYPDGTNGEVYDTVTKTWKLPIGLREIAEGTMLSPKHEVVVAGAASWLVDAARPPTWTYRGFVLKFFTTPKPKVHHMPQQVVGYWQSTMIVSSSLVTIPSGEGFNRKTKTQNMALSLTVETSEMKLMIDPPPHYTTLGPHAAMQPLSSPAKSSAVPLAVEAAPAPASDAMYYGSVSTMARRAEAPATRRGLARLEAPGKTKASITAGIRDSNARLDVYYLVVPPSVRIKFIQKHTDISGCSRLTS
ncbi:hypothetical protein CHU98_g8155 [Xylaria longipes]|nr:hypothetical protein CHU98_g8155 [Xylaria longipes]